MKRLIITTLFLALVQIVYAQEPVRTALGFVGKDTTTRPTNDNTYKLTVDPLRGPVLQGRNRANDIPLSTTSIIRGSLKSRLNQIKVVGGNDRLFGDSARLELAANVVLDSSLAVPALVGGSATTSALNIFATRGVGTTGSNINFKVGNNGSITPLSLRHNGDIYTNLPQGFPKIGVDGKMTSGSLLATDIPSLTSTYIPKSGNSTLSGQLIIENNNSENAIFNSNLSGGYKVALKHAGNVFGNVGNNLFSGGANTDFSIQAANLLKLGVGSTAVMQLNSSGNVGFGSSPTADKVRIAGSLNTNSLRVSGVTTKGVFISDTLGNASVVTGAGFVKGDGTVDATTYATKTYTDNTFAQATGNNTFSGANTFNNIRFANGNQGSKKMMISDANGNADWQTINSLNYSSVASLKAGGASEAGVKVKLTGFYVNGDGGGGDFVWDATSTATANDGIYIQPTGVTTGRWKRMYEDEINVKWFGAKGDNVTDDTQAFQKAIDFRLLAGGKIFIPAGNYIITNTLQFGDTKGIELVGESPQDAIIKFNNSVEDKELFYLSPLSSYCIFQNFMIMDVTPGKSIGIKAKDQLGDSKPNWKMYFHNIRFAFLKVGYMATTDTPLIGGNHGFLDGVTFSHCKFRNCRTSYYNQNSQAVNINFFNTDSENDDAGENYTHIKDEAGFTLNVFGGSWIGKGKIYDGVYSTSGATLFTSANITFTGTRFEIRSVSTGDLLTFPKRLSTIFLNFIMNGCSFAGFGQTLSFANFAGKANLQINDCTVISGNFIINQYPTSGISGADAVGGMHTYGSVHVRRSRGFTYVRNDNSPYGTFDRAHTAAVKIEQVPPGPTGQFTLDAQSFMTLVTPELSQRAAGLGYATSNMLVYNSDSPTKGFKSIRLKLPYYSTPMALVLFKHPVAYAEAITYKLYFVKDNADWADPLTFNVATDAILLATSGSTANKAGFMEFPVSFTDNYLTSTSYFQSGFGKWLEGRLFLEHSGSANNFQGFVGVKYL